MADVSKNKPAGSHEQKGLLLKQIRESKGLTLQVAHEATKIPLDALRAIEEGYTVRTLSTFYRRGFLKKYAQYLGVDVAKVIDDYEPEHLPQHIDSRPVDTGLKDVFESLFSSSRVQPVLRIALVVLALFLVVKAGSFTLRLFLRPKTDTPKAAVSTPAREPQARRQVIEQPPAERAVQRTRPAEPPAPRVAVTTEQRQKNIRLTARAKQDSWLQVTVDGMDVFRGTVQRGSVNTWSGDDTIEISGRNINQLEFEQNGNLIGSLGRIDRRIRRVLFTRTGFTVKE